MKDLSPLAPSRSGKESRVFDKNGQIRTLKSISESLAKSISWERTSNPAPFYTRASAAISNALKIRAVKKKKTITKVKT